MNAIKTVYNEIPSTIKIPKEFIHKKGEIIIIAEENLPDQNKKYLKNFFGILPNFPERADQGEYEKREAL